MFIQQKIPRESSRVESKGDGERNSGDLLEVSARLFLPRREFLMVAQLEGPSSAPAQVGFDYDEVGDYFSLLLL